VDHGNLYGDGGAKAIWLRIENRSDPALWLLALVLDANCLLPRKALQEAEKAGIAIILSG